MPKRLPKQVKLYNYGVDKVGVGESRPDVMLNISHKEAEPDQDHDVDVLEHGVVVGVVGGVVLHLRSQENPVKHDYHDLY